MKKANVLFLVLMCGFFAIAAIAAPATAAGKTAKTAAIVANGKTVTVNYTLTVDGKVVDSTKGRKPLEFKEGAHQVVPGFEKGLIGMKVGQKKSLTIPPDEGYGQVNPKAVRVVSRKELPAGVTPKTGMVLLAEGKDGRKIPVTIKQVEKDSVVIDLNHPLAGKTLHVDVEVVGIK